MDTDFLISAFEGMANSVLLFAGFVKEPFVPGMVVTLLLLALAFIVFRFWIWSSAQLRAIAQVSHILVGAPIKFAGLDADELRAEFYNRQPEVTSELTKFGQKKSPAAKRLAFAWREYRETLKVDSDAGTLLNGIRPSVFFNTEDLDTEARGWRVVPGLFVSIGLAATFLGLIAALQQTGQALMPSQQLNELVGQASGPTEALQKLLEIASAKFIMSLTGLICSIAFTIVLRARLGKIEHAIDHLCMDIEKRVGFIALESLAFDQKKLMEEQKAHSQKFDAELIAFLGKSLQEDLPNAISASISQSMEPMLKQVGQVGSDGMREMVGDLANQISGDVSRAMGDAANRFDTAAARIETLSETLGVKSSDMQTAMGAANKEQLEAAESISSAAKMFAERVDLAGQDASAQVSSQLDGLRANLSSQLTNALNPLLTQASTLAEEAGDQVVKPVRELATAIE